MFRYIRADMMTMRFINRECGRVLVVSIKLTGTCDIEMSCLDMAPDGRSQSTPPRRLLARLNKVISRGAGAPTFSYEYGEHIPNTECDGQ